MAHFPNPCPVCGDEEEHASWRRTVTGSPATCCPHPAELGHGTGCCCAGLAIPPWIVRPKPPEPATLEERVAALEDAVGRMQGRTRLRQLPPVNMSADLSPVQVKTITAQIQAELLKQAKRGRRGGAA